MQEPLNMQDTFQKKERKTKYAVIGLLLGAICGGAMYFGY